MDVLYGLPFCILQEPNVKIKKPSFIKAPSSTLVFAFVMVSYFLVTGGVIYDVIVEPPSIGSTTDEFGHSKPVAFMQVCYNNNNNNMFHYMGFVYVVSCQWAVHNGRVSIQFSL